MRGKLGEREDILSMQKLAYDTHYFENMLEMYAGSGMEINRRRWDFIGDAIQNECHVLDFGSGCGMFGLFKPDHVIYDSYDIGKIGDAQYPQTGIRHDWYTVVCFWDVLEHVDWENEPDDDILAIMQRTDFIAATLPIHPTDKPIEGWKHWKPNEHLTYFTDESFIAFMKEQCFELMLLNTVECPPRKDIHSYLFRELK